MKVSEFFEAEKLTKDDVVHIADESSYWDTSSTFVFNNWERDIESLSPKQAKWLDKIHEDLTERRIEGRL